MPFTSQRRVVVTGLGLVSPIGNTPESFWEALAGGRSGVGPLGGVPDAYLPIRWGAEVPDFTGDIADFGPLDKDQTRSIRKGVKVMCREIQMGVAAAQKAYHHAGLSQNAIDPDRAGVVYGSDYIMTLPEEFAEAVRGCLDDERAFHFDRWAERGLPKVTPLWLLKYLPNMPASHIAIYNDLRGPNNSLTLREASANLAIGEAYATIQRDTADVMIAGATGTRVHPLRTVHVTLQEQLACGGDDPARLCRPFDRNRTGMVVGEGAGAIVLEELQHALRRQATILGEVTGFGSSTVLDRRGVARLSAALVNALRQTLASSGADPLAIGHIHAHGLSTTTSDIEESKAIVEVFGRDSRIPVAAAKSYFGNPGAAGGILESIASLMALNRGTLFPVLNYETPDPECPIPVAAEPCDAGDSFVSLSVTPQGQSSAVMMRRFAGA